MLDPLEVHLLDFPNIVIKVNYLLKKILMNYYYYFIKNFYKRNKMKLILII